MNDIDDHGAPPPDWIAALDRSEAQFAAGDTIPAASVHRMLRASIARIEARSAGEAPAEVAPAR